MDGGIEVFAGFAAQIGPDLIQIDRKSHHLWSLHLAGAEASITAWLRLADLD
jgi:hypothetical protein